MENCDEFEKLSRNADSEVLMKPKIKKTANFIKRYKLSKKKRSIAKITIQHQRQMFPDIY